MPDFSKADSKDLALPRYARQPSRYENERDAGEQRAAIQRDEKKMAPPQPFEPRCHVCVSPYRNFVDTLLIKGGHSYVEIARLVPGTEGKPLERRSVANHAKNHLGYAEAAIRAVLEEEAERAGRNYEEAVSGAITHRGTLEVALRKAHEDIINGVSTVEPKDLIKIVELLGKMDQQTAEVQADEYRAQMNAFIEAIRINVPREMWEKIANDAKSIYAGENPNGASVLPEVVDAVPVED